MLQGSRAPVLGAGLKLLKSDRKTRILLSRWVKPPIFQTCNGQKFYRGKVY